MTPPIKFTAKKRGRPKTGRPSLDLGTPETRRYRLALLTINKDKSVKDGKIPVSSAIDVLYHRGRLTQTGWQNALKLFQLWRQMRRVIEAPRPLTATIQRLKGRPCTGPNPHQEQKILGRYRAIIQGLTCQNPAVVDHIHYLFYRADPLDYPYLSRHDLEATLAVLESASI